MFSYVTELVMLVSSKQTYLQFSDVYLFSSALTLEKHIIKRINYLAGSIWLEAETGRLPSVFMSYPVKICHHHVVLRSGFAIYPCLQGFSSIK